MSANSGIEWTHHTFNGWWGCVEVSPACDFCYARTFANRYHQGLWGKDASRKMFGQKHWNEPLKWNRQAKAEGKRKRVFCGSMMDIMESRQELNEPRRRIYSLVEMTPWLDWMFLTKRPGMFRHLLPNRWIDKPPFRRGPENLWLGTTVESNKYLHRIDQLKSVPATVHFLSIEPLLEELHLTREHLRDIELVIVGGESGPKARPMNPDWVRSIRDMCVAAGVPFFFKQWGEWAPGECINTTQKKTEKGAFWDQEFGWNFASISKKQSEEMHRDDQPDLWKVGKKAAGRILDGRTWDEMPAFSSHPATPAAGTPDA